MSTITQVVIIGGGGGASLARALSQSLSKAKKSANTHITVITPYAFSLWRIASARVIVRDLNKSLPNEHGLLPLDRIFDSESHGTVLVDRVTTVHDGQLELASGKKVAYDVLVFATGSLWDGPFEFPEGDETRVLAHINSYRAKIQRAKRIAIIGGGAVGIELAAEIKETYPDKPVTIVHGGKKLLNDAYPSKFRDGLARRVGTTGVQLQLGSKVDVEALPQELLSGANKEISFVTASGSRLSADLVIPSRGPRPNTDFISTLSPNILTASGRVRVLPTLQVDFSSASPKPSSSTRIFAMGDIIDWDEQHMFTKAAEHVKVLTKNIAAAITAHQTRAKEPAGLVLYKGAPEAIAVTIGQKGGQLYVPMLWGPVLGDWVVAKIKSGELFLPMGKKSVGY